MRARKLFFSYDMSLIDSLSQIKPDRPSYIPLFLFICSGVIGIHGLLIAWILYLGPDEKREVPPPLPRLIVQTVSLVEPKIQVPKQELRPVVEKPPQPQPQEPVPDDVEESLKPIAQPTEESMKPIAQPVEEKRETVPPQVPDITVVEDLKPVAAERSKEEKPPEDPPISTSEKQSKPPAIPPLVKKKLEPKPISVLEKNKTVKNANPKNPTPKNPAPKKNPPKKNTKPAPKTTEKIAKAPPPIKKKEVAVKDTKAMERERKEAEALKLRQEEESLKARQEAENLKRRQKLVAEAKEKLSKMNTQAFPSNEKTEESKVPHPITSLHIESQGTSSNEKVTDVERSYLQELSDRLQQQLKFPEYGDVKLELTLERSGKMIKVNIIYAHSALNRKCVEKKLPTLSLPPFGACFKADTRTFVIILKND